MSNLNDLTKNEISQICPYQKGDSIKAFKSYMQIRGSFTVEEAVEKAKDNGFEIKKSKKPDAYYKRIEHLLDQNARLKKVEEIYYIYGALEKIDKDTFRVDIIKAREFLNSKLSDKIGDGII